MFSKVKFSFFLLSTLLLSAPVWAADSIEACLAEHENCVDICLEKESVGSKAACIAQCGVSEAKCAGELGLKTSEPIIRDKIEELEGFMKRFMDDFLPKTDPQPEPARPNHTDT